MLGLGLMIHVEGEMLSVFLFLCSWCVFLCLLPFWFASPSPRGAFGNNFR